MQVSNIQITNNQDESIILKAENAVNQYLNEREQSRQLFELGLPPLPVRLSYSLNSREIDYAQEIMSQDQSRFVLAKRYHSTGISVYYYLHTDNRCYTVTIHDNDIYPPTVC